MAAVENISVSLHQGTVKDILVANKRQLRAMLLSFLRVLYLYVIARDRQGSGEVKSYLPHPEIQRWAGVMFLKRCTIRSNYRNIFIF
jgi:hypothetical protein